MNNKPLKCMDNIQADKRLKQQTLTAVMNHSVKSFPKVRWVSFAGLILFLIVSMTLFNPVNAQPYTYIAMDINPSFEIVLDKKDKVIEVNAYNQEANTLKESLDIDGLSYQKALEMLVADDFYQEYFTQGAFLQVSIYSKDESRAYEIEQNICSYLDTSKMKDQYGCTCVDEQVHNNAKGRQMSGGKYMMIEKILDLDDRYSFSELEGKSMSALKQIYSQLTGEEIPRHKNSKHH